MRHLRTAAAVFLVSMLAMALASGIATARPTTVGKTAVEATAGQASTPRHRHPLSMPFFSFKPRS